MICKLPDAKRRFAQKSVLRLKAKWKLHTQTQESSKMICNLPDAKRRFAPEIVLAACGRTKITFVNAGK